ncbi:cactin homolog, putative [Plasmodium gallinaceum]|uniref:Splicing factor Cactin n=1 Tax=Plasmodium gallinaceum TaxID=5849 RepID=A0A1J1GLA1_PLAGA|nr:cactin homolog, putative [Plasmodium gallinaceum]CRG93099.1 cactin homolog, putative [Plasmodium gallinaceum]
MKRHFNYTDECNPFGDNTLSTPFVWKLKNKYEKIKNDNKIKLTTNTLLENSISKISEIEEVKKRREEREKERSLLEDYRLQLEKQRNQINIKEYKEKEQIFFINQEIQSSNHRISHNIIQPVDLFRIAIKIINNEEIQNFYYSYFKLPFYNILEGLKERELENCEKQIKLHMLHDKMFNEEKYKKYWESLLYFAEFYLDNLNNGLERSDNIVDDEKINKKIKLFFENKNYDELTIFEEKIKKKIISDDLNFDVNYWNNVLLKIPYFKSKYILDDFHKKLHDKISVNKENTCLPHKVSQNNEENGVIKKEEKNIIDMFECESPLLYSLESLEDDDIYIYKPEEELEEREKINEEILRKLKKKDNNDEKIDDINEENTINKFYKKDKEIYDNFVRREKKKGIKDEIIMKDISLHTLTNTLKCSLFVTRKPLYFNRIKTSFDWNKYNKTHYDYENTPPKYICGYKFNIFYTNLLNKKQPPTWKLQHTDDENKVLIIFHGGAPYLDIAFKIVNAEWSFDKNKGFRNVFDKGILQLYFNFKKKRYRR